MMRATGILAAALMMIVSITAPASADWLLTGYISSVSEVKTSASSTLRLKAEEFDDSLGFGVNVASAFPSRNNLGFEFDLGVYPNALQNSNEFSTLFASRLISISTNFFYSPAVPRVRPYFTVGPNFGFRFDHSDAARATPSGWAVGLNGGGGIIAFVNRHVGGRVDVRYFRNFGEFYDLREEVTTTRRTRWNNLQFVRVFVGATFVL